MPIMGASSMSKPPVGTAHKRVARRNKSDEPSPLASKYVQSSCKQARFCVFFGAAHAGQSHLLLQCGTWSRQCKFIVPLVPLCCMVL
jgi:hypothetical protein